MIGTEKQHRTILQNIAHRVMLERGLLPDFSAEALAELATIEAPAVADDGLPRDLRDILWASIDNDDSLDLDQLTVAEVLPGGTVKIMVAVADVDALVRNGSAIDDHARHNTTSVYTAATIFSMLPDKLSTNLTSLSFKEDRLAVVIEMIVGAGVVRTPKRWARIVEFAREHGFDLSDTPDPEGLEKFLMKEKGADPFRFPDLSLAIIKLLGPGEYVAKLPGDTHAPGHFGLAVRDYTHSTAPNRRYPDLITQRMLKSAMSQQPPPYAMDNLEALAKHCTEAEDEAKKVERQVEKSAAALLLESRIGERFDAIVTGAAPKGTWVRLFDVPVEGRLMHGFEGVDVGHSISVQLIRTDVDRGFIDFKRVQ
jgi:exoribonuclease R